MFNITGNQALDYAIMESDAKRQELERLFNKYISMNIDPNKVQEQVYKEAGFTPQDLMPEDVRLLKLNVEWMVRNYGCW